jgi:predicted ATP-binding protein involved in virulence
LKINFIKSSIFITLEENIDKFIEQNKNPNIKPLFLKKIEDVDLLLNVLENDLKGKESQKIEQKEIARIDSIHIQNFFSIKNIELSNLHDKKEIYVVGENGDGKTLLLQAITIALAGVKEGDVFDLVKNQQEYSLVVWDTQKNEYNQNAQDAYEYILAYGASRNNYCQLKEDHTGYLSLFTSEYDLKNPIEWLQYLDYREKDEKRNIISVTRAKALLNHLLNTDISIDITPDKVSFSEKGSAVSFEQLSAGYKGVITLVCDMIARFSHNQQVENIAQFQGIVLIDEIELHLHPRWQYSFMRKLRETFPLIQFIVTTHSPTILLGSSMEAVYYTIYKEEGVVKISVQKEVNNNFLNDIQSTIFGFDVNEKRIHNPSQDDERRQKRAKEGLLSLIDTIEKAQ